MFFQIGLHFGQDLLLVGKVQALKMMNALAIIIFSSRPSINYLEGIISEGFHDLSFEFYHFLFLYWLDYLYIKRVWHLLY